MKHLLAYMGLRAGLGLIGAMPASLARRLGGLGGRLWYRADASRRRMARRNMERVLGDPVAASKAAPEVMESYGRYWAEAMWIRAKRAPEMLASTEATGLDMVVAARDAGKGMIYGLPHMGNWEAAAPLADSLDIGVVAVAENLANRRITDWFTSMRAELGIEVVLATGSVEVMRKLEAGLDANKAVALLSDRDLKGRGVPVEFFGEETTLPPGPATLAIRTGAPLFPVATYFTDDGYRIVVRPPLAVPGEGSRSQRVREMTQSLAAELEELIREAPSQWHMVVPNWPSDRE